jgi:hypothetical protein
MLLRVIPIGCLFSVMVILLFSGLALAQILWKSAENVYEERAKEGAVKLRR